MTPRALFLPHIAPELRSENVAQEARPENNAPEARSDDDDLFLPSEFARSVWSLELVHGAATAALLARTAERALRPGLRIVRLTVDLMRPVPLQPLAARAVLVRDGKRIQVIQAGLYLVGGEGDGLEVGRATALAMRESDLSTEGVLEIDAATPPDPETLAAMPGKVTSDGGSYHDSIEWRSSEEWGTAERPMLWIRNRTHILPGEPLSPVARAVATADALSPLANFAPPFADDSIGFINADITLYLHREPSDEWLCVVAQSRQSGRGYAVSSGALYDRRGPVGRIVLASLAQVHRPRGMV